MIPGKEVVGLQSIVPQKRERSYDAIVQTVDVRLERKEIAAVQLELPRLVELEEYPVLRKVIDQRFNDRD